MSGYFGIGIENTKTGMNVGTLWRSAQIMGAAFIFTIGNRYKLQSSDTLKTPRNIPLYNYKSFNEFYAATPYDCMLVGAELVESAIPISEFEHPKRCIYLLGAEDNGLTNQALNACHKIIQLPGKFSLNVAVAGSIIMYDRISWALKGEAVINGNEK
jgi:tRNA G18 (ribose-2'-O)-methylase SpoU